MKKRGISPLIATVLIIGFTVALAAIIITWSTGFTKRMQEQTEETANVQVICATDVIFDIKSVCKVDGALTYKVLIQNDGKENLKDWKIRLYKDENTVDSNPTITPLPTGSDKMLPAFGVKQYEITTDLDSVSKIEAFPLIEKGGKSITCSQNVDAYGDASGSPIGSDASTQCV